jgi:hypothetical protein
MPMPRPSAQIHEAVSAVFAPTAWAAAKTIATELVKPTSTATKPATTAGRDRSRKGLDVDMAGEHSGRCRRA